MCQFITTLLLFLSLPAHAQADSKVLGYFVSVNRLYEALEYEQALEQISQARRLSLSVADKVDLSLYEGLILADMNRWEESSAAFKAALSLNPAAKLPVKVSPKVTQHLEAVRRQVQRDLTLSKVPLPGAKSPLVEQNPLKAPPARTLPDSHALPAAAKDEAGKPESLALDRHTAADITRYRRQWSAWKPWAVVGAGAAVALAGGALHLQARGNFEKFDTRIVQCGGCVPVPEVIELHTRGKSMQHLAFGAYAVGGVGLATGAVLAFINRPQAYRITPEDAGSAQGASVTPLLGRGEGGVLAAFRF